MWGEVIGGRAVVVALGAVLAGLLGCQTTSGPGEPSATASSPGSSATATGQPTRPTAQDFQIERSRGPVTATASTFPLQGVASGVVIDPIVGEAYITTCRGCAGEAPAMTDVLQVADLAARAPTDEIDLTGPMPGMYPRVAADPYAAALYATRAGTVPPGSISVIGAAGHEVMGAIRVGAGGLWGIAVDPTSGLVYVMQEGSSGDSSGVLTIVDPASSDVLDRIPLQAEAGSGISIDPAHARVLIGDPGSGRLIVVDAGTREVARTVQVVPGMDDPCENCLGYLGTPVADPTTGLVYLSGPASVGQAQASNALGHGPGTVRPAGLFPGDATVVPAGGGSSAVYVVDPEAGEVIDVIPVPGMVVWTRACDPAAGVVYLTNIGQPATGVLALDTATRELGAVLPVEGETTLAVDPGSGEVWVAGNGSVTILE
jgi:DNA-binding beta-propeller fold protein YncE